VGYVIRKQSSTAVIHTFAGGQAVSFAIPFADDFSADDQVATYTALSSTFNLQSTGTFTISTYYDITTDTGSELMASLRVIFADDGIAYTPVFQSALFPFDNTHIAMFDGAASVTSTQAGSTFQVQLVFAEAVDLATISPVNGRNPAGNIEIMKI
jgi:hypothetical protein